MIERLQYLVAWVFVKMLGVLPRGVARGLAVGTVRVLLLLLPLLNLYPAPNFSDPNNRYNYVYSVLRPNDRNQFTSRFDYNVSDKHKISFDVRHNYRVQAKSGGVVSAFSNVLTLTTPP